MIRLSPASGMLRQRAANKKAGQLNTKGAMFKNNRQTMFALTADKLYVLETKIDRSGIRILGQLAEWNRSDLRVETIPGRLATKVVLDHADGGHYELEATTAASQGYHDALLSALSSWPS